MARVPYPRWSGEQTIPPPTTRDRCPITRGPRSGWRRRRSGRPSALEPLARRVGEVDDVAERVVPRLPGPREVRPPARRDVDEGQRVAQQQPDEHLGDDAAADRAQVRPAGQDFGLLEDVVPE